VKRKAFSLIELLIVVVIVGLVYTLAISNFENVKQKKVRPTLTNLKSYLDKLDKTDVARLICLDECKSCYVYVDKKLDANVSEEFEDFLDEQPRLYKYDINYGLESLKNKIFFNSEGVDEQICFSLSVDKNGVSDQVIVEYKDKFYDFSPYFSDTKVYSSASELRNYRENLRQEALR
jgi:prepilin-type N-terminal cleavage/methylation domain-containing protein